MRLASVGAVVLLSLGLITGVQAQVVIDTVRVGDLGNADDTGGDGYGGVDYVYDIGTFEVTAGQYTEFLNAVAATDTYGVYTEKMDLDVYPGDKGCNIKRSGSSGSYTYSVAPDWANHPVNCVSWGDAARFANWLHNGQADGDTETGSYMLNGAMSNAELLGITREAGASWVIPSEDEWYKAAYYDGGRDRYYDYPTGTNTRPSNVLSNPAPDPGNNANYYHGGYTIGSPYWRTEVGDFENSDSPYATFDQGGNVWEWNEAVIASSRGLRGGSFCMCNSYLEAEYRNYSVPAYEGAYVGFRVAFLPEDCNGNGMLDAEDIAYGTSRDCQPNGVPDECDIAEHRARDKFPLPHGDGIPDVCQIDRPTRD
ncbi:MAG: formylglycine-generating enzyme family protein [Planctomycetota bacterium]|jgi:formylglycine-generating enzyme required for sulfatase activity